MRKSIEGLFILAKVYWKYHVQILEFILLIQKTVNKLSKNIRPVILAYATVSYKNKI